MAKKTIKEELEPMAVGDSKEFPAEQCNNVQSCSSMYGFKWNKTFRTKIDRDRRVITVTRIA